MTDTTTDGADISGTADDIDLTDSPFSDFLGFELLLDDEDRALLSRVRAHMTRIVEPVINEYWTRAEFPHDLVAGIAGLGIAGAGVRRARLPGARRARSTAWSRWSWPGSTRRSPPSWACTAAWRWARSTCAAPTSRRSAGCPRWRGWS